MNILPVIIAGGFGTRLFPLSTINHPKQFMNLVDGKYSLFQQTFKRIRNVCKEEKIIICCNEKHIKLVCDQISDINENNYVILAEKEKKNTFASIFICFKFAKSVLKSDIIFVSPSDSYINKDDNFIKNIRDGIYYSSMFKKHVLFGIEPTRIDNNYGYIVAKKSTCKSEFYDVQFFIEKPDVDTIKKIAYNEYYFWNSGHFIFNIEELYNDLKSFLKDDFHKFDKMIFFEKNQKNIYVTNDNFLRLPNIQVDKAIIEKNNNLVCLKAMFEWYDIGSFEVLNFLTKKNR